MLCHVERSEAPGRTGGALNDISSTPTQPDPSLTLGMTSVVLIDSPVANVANIARGLRSAGADLRVTRDPDVIASARKVVLPGVGSFIAAMQWLREHAIDTAIRRAVDSGAFVLGICVGHQALFDVSYEMGTTPGLGLVRGEVHKFEGPLPVPQIGWNRVAGTSLLPAEPTPFYFVNSYAAIESPHAIGHANYGGPFVAAVQNGRVFGVQFHPEKSSTAGLQVLRNFVAWS